MMKKLIFITLAVGALTGCHGGWEQDPLKEQPDAIRNGIYPDEIKRDTRPLATKRDALIIDSDTFFDFTEGAEGSLEIKGRMGVPGVPYELRLTNEDRVRQMFPGIEILYEDRPIKINNSNQSSTPANPQAVQTEKVLILKWKPPENFVDGDLVCSTVDDRVRVRMFASICASATGELAPCFVEKTIHVKVKRNIPDRLKIINVEGPKVGGNLQVAEGEKGTFFVTVQDPESMTDRLLPDGHAPELKFVRDDNPRLPGIIDAYQFLKFEESGNVRVPPTQDPRELTKWTFAIHLNLEKQDLTKNKSNMQFTLRAYNRFGEESDPFTVNLKVINTVTEPGTTWGFNDKPDFYTGEQSTFYFTVYDPRSEGEIDVNFETQCSRELPGEGSCTCELTGATKHRRLCKVRLRVDPRLVKKEEYSVVYHVVNKNPLEGVIQSSKIRQTSRLRIKTAQ